MANIKPNVFVAMPFSETVTHTENYWTSHFTQFLKPLIESVPDMIAERSEALRGDLLREIITKLVDQEVVVADLTDGNANVYWELGVRQSFKNGTIIIAEIGVDVGFDVSTKGVLRYYPGDHLKNAEFQTAFKAALVDCRTNPDGTDSQVLEAISGRGSLYEIIQRSELIRRLEAIDSECKDNLGVIKDLRALIEANEKENDAKIPTYKFRVFAVALLISWRYLDKPPKFYDEAEVCMDFLLRMNGQLDAWENSAEKTQIWVNGGLESVDKSIKALRARCQSARKALAAAR